MLSAYFENNLDRLKRSMWTIPFLMTILFLILAISLNYLDLILKENDIPLINNNWGINVQGIQSLFSNIAGAIITAMTTILSITLLVFTVLSGQYGAHVFRVFQI